MAQLRIGIIGGGQLARMMVEAATPLGLRLAVLAEGPEVSAAQVVPEARVGDFTDIATVTAFAAGLDALTCDHEHVPPAVLTAVAEAGVAVRPGPQALLHASDKAVMRRRLTEMGIPCPRWRVVADPQDLADFGTEHGWPVIAKVSRGGYDGKGVWRLSGRAETAVPFEALQGPQGPTEAQRTAADPAAVIVAEEYVPFARELSVLVARRPGGESVAYPVTETVQRDGICHTTISPAPGLVADRAAEIHQMARRIAHELDVVGILAVELMERPDGQVVVNELAMRPHNTGHWTIEGAVTSQFENHLRAVADLPLGSPELRSPVVAMNNVLGGANSDLLGSLGSVLADGRVKVHLYGKGVRPGRKVGHVTVCGDLPGDVQAAAARAAAYLENGRD
ncbi:MAG: 5-(carboxyamino)imidazole ribonucleotide synthase [Propioniciclava sp.]